MLDVEDALQTATEIFRADHGEARTAPHALGHAKVAVTNVRIVVLQGRVDAAVQHDVGLSLRERGQGCRNGQREKRFLH